MAKMIVILCSAAVFAVIGLTAAYMIASKATHQGPGSLSDGDMASFFFVLPLIGTVVGLIVGCVAAYFGKKFGDGK